MGSDCGASGRPSPAGSGDGSSSGDDDDFEIVPCADETRAAPGAGGEDAQVANPSRASEPEPVKGELGCFQCGATYDSEYALTVHVNTQHLCAICDVLCSDLRAHNLEMGHYLCPCGDRFGDEPAYLQHLAACDVPDQRERDSCPLCGQSLQGMSAEARQDHEEGCGEAAEGSGPPERRLTRAANKQAAAPAAAAEAGEAGAQRKRGGARKRRRAEEPNAPASAAAGAARPGGEAEAACEELSGAEAEEAPVAPPAVCCFCRQPQQVDMPPLEEFKHGRQSAWCHEVCAAFCPNVQWVRCAPLSAQAVVRAADAAAQAECHACRGQRPQVAAGATLTCLAPGCTRRWHLPCARGLADADAAPRAVFLYSRAPDEETGESHKAFFCPEHSDQVDDVAGEQRDVATEQQVLRRWAGGLASPGRWFRALPGGWRQLAHGVAYHRPGGTAPLTDPPAERCTDENMRLVCGMRLSRLASERCKSMMTTWENKKGPLVQRIVEKDVDSGSCPACDKTCNVCACCVAVRELIQGQKRVQGEQKIKSLPEALTIAGEDLVKLQKVGEDDPRHLLHGHTSVVACQRIPRGKVIMMYQGLQTTVPEYRRHGASPPPYKSTADWQTHLDSHSQEMVAFNSHGTVKMDHLIVTPFEAEEHGGISKCVFSGNPACHINDPTVNVAPECRKLWRTKLLDKGHLHDSNVEVLLHYHPPGAFGNVKVLEFSCCGWPLPFVVACADIEEGSELLMSYGAEFWRRHPNLFVVLHQEPERPDQPDEPAQGVAASPHAVPQAVSPHPPALQPVPDAEDIFWDEGVRPASAAAPRPASTPSKQPHVETANKFGDRGVWPYANSESWRGLSWKHLAEREGPGTATGLAATATPTLGAPPQRLQEAPAAAPPMARTLRQRAAAQTAANARPVGRAGGLYDRLRR